MVALGRLSAASSYDDVAEAIVLETIRRGYSRAECIACLSTGIQESSLRPGAVSANGLWVSIYQQDASYPGRSDPNTNISGFLDRFDVKRSSSGASSDPFMNIFWLQQRPGELSADAAYANGRRAYLTEIKSRLVEATRLFELYSGGVVVAVKPDFNEYMLWSPSYQSRSGVKPSMFLLHTQEGAGNADSLARYLGNAANQVSYHYTVSQADDGGVTVVDVVDTDYASWSVGNFNNQSINLCFAGSKASWSREQWLKQAKAIDVAAYLAAQDCRKYGIAPIIVPAPYNAGTPGISDHQYVTKVLKWGTHTDVGPNFPWDVFTASFSRYMGIAVAQPETPVPAPAGFKYPSTDEMILQIWEQFFGYQARGFEGLFGKTGDGKRGKYPVEALGDLHEKWVA